ncbi:MAG: TRAP transporter small permease [Ostreibacterium sp.]
MNIGLSKKLNQLNHHIEQVNGFVIITLTSLMVVCVVWQVISRYIFGSPSTITDEMARFLFMWVGLLGAVQAAFCKEHLAIDLLILKVSGWQKVVLNLFVESCILLFAILVMIWGGGMLTEKTFVSHQITPSLQIPMGTIYMIIPIGGIIITYLSLTNIYNLVLHANQVKENDHGVV